MDDTIEAKVEVKEPKEKKVKANVEKTEKGMEFYVCYL